MPAVRRVADPNSAPALREAAGAHPRIAAITCDIWQRLPIQRQAADLVVNVFAPRNRREIARVLATHGALVVVTPTARHLHELVSALGLLEVGADKQDRLRRSLSPDLVPVASRGLDLDLTLGHAEIRALVAMGPSSHHVSAAALTCRRGRLPDPMAVSASVSVDTFRPAPPAALAGRRTGATASAAR